MLHGAAEPQAPMADWAAEASNAAGAGSFMRKRQGTGARRHREPQQKQVQGPGVQQQQPSDLEVWEGWELFEEDAVLRTGVKLRCAAT